MANLNPITEEDLVHVDPRILREEAMVAKREGLGQMPDKTLDDFGFVMNRLHDPTNFDHTTLEVMLATFKFRNLEKSKIFRIAKKVFGDKMDPKFRTRTRAFNVSGLKSGTAVISGERLPIPTHDEETIDSDEDLNDMNDCRLFKNPAKKRVVITGSSDNKEITPDTMDDYYKWMEKRQELRASLNKLGLSESWLRNKPDKTVVENQLYDRLLNKDKDLYIGVEDDDIDTDILQISKDVEGLPRIRRTSPLALRKLDQFLKANNMRLLDIFRMIDKDKNWLVSRKEFMNAVAQYNLDISPALLEDLMATLDTDNIDELCYKDFAKGLELYKLEKRDAKKKRLSAKSQGVEEPISEEEEVDIDSSGPQTHLTSEPSTRLTSAKSAQRVKSSGSAGSTILETPDIDLQESRLVMRSQENQVDIRKRDRDFLKYRGPRGTSSTPDHFPPAGSKPSSVFKTGYKPIDDHCLPSTMGGTTASMINEYRQKVLKEYHAVRDLCEERGVVLSTQLLDRVLLHPGDKNVKLIKKQGIRQPGTHLPLSQHFADSPRRPRTPIEIRNRGKIRRGKDGVLRIAYNHLFPSRKEAEPRCERMQLSTGKALVCRKVDCWMTFEEYMATRNSYEERFVKMGGDTDMNKFWPGYMIDKIRQLTDDETGRPSNAVFRHARRDPPVYHGYDNNLNIWNVSDTGYLQQGRTGNPKTSFNIGQLLGKERPEHRVDHMFTKPTQGLTMHTNF